MPITRSQAQKMLSSESRPAKVSSVQQQVRSRKLYKKNELPTSKGEHVQHRTSKGAVQANRREYQDYDEDGANTFVENSAVLSSDDDFTDGEDDSIRSSFLYARSSGGKHLHNSEDKDVSFGKRMADDTLMLNRRLLKVSDSKTYADTSLRGEIQSHNRVENKAGKSLSLVCGSILLLMGIMACLLLVVFSYKTTVSTPNIQTELSQEIQTLKTIFPSQEGQFWDLVESTVANHLEQGLDPKGPIVFLFGSHRDASYTTKCLAKKLENFFSKALQEKSADVTIIDGNDFEKQNADDAKLRLDNRLQEAFNGGQKAAIIFNLDALPPCSVLLFHSYCENESARFKNVALIFTVTLQNDLSMNAIRSKPLNLKNEEAYFIYRHLSQAWVGKCKFLTEEKVEALLSRVANNVGIIRKENTVPC